MMLSEKLRRWWQMIDKKIDKRVVKRSFMFLVTV